MSDVSETAEVSPETIGAPPRAGAGMAPEASSAAPAPCS